MEVNEMKKIFAIAILGITLISSSTVAFAGNNVSNMAVNMGGRSVAECAKMMDQGVSQCIKTCNMQ